MRARRSGEPKPAADARAPQRLGTLGDARWKRLFVGGSCSTLDYASMSSEMKDTDSQKPCNFEILRDQEYNVLREELKINRQFVFERPLLIVGVSFAALTNLKDPASLQAGALLFLLLLFYNLWFTFNRLSSNSRILGYLRVVHESADARCRPGWETSLGRYREWLACHSEKYRRVVEECAKLKLHDSNRFFRGIFWFHILSGGLSVFIALNRALEAGASAVSVSLALGTVVVYVAGAVLSLTSWNPYRIRNPIEVETIVWKQVLAS